MLYQVIFYIVSMDPLIILANTHQSVQGYLEFMPNQVSMIKPIIGHALLNKILF